MFKRVCIVLTALLVVGTTFVACKKEAKKEEPAVAVAQDQAAAAQAEAAGQAEADAQLQAAAAQVEAAVAQVEAAADELDLAALLAQAGAAAPLADVPPEAQAAIDVMLDVMSAIADTAGKETCAEMVDALKLLDNDEMREKIKKNVQILENFPEDVQMALQQANQARFFGVAIRMSGFQKCEDTPQADEIDKVVASIMSAGEE